MRGPTVHPTSMDIDSLASQDVENDNNDTGHRVNQKRSRFNYIHLTIIVAGIILLVICIIVIPILVTQNRNNTEHPTATITTTTRTTTTDMTSPLSSWIDSDKTLSIFSDQSSNTSRISTNSQVFTSEESTKLSALTEKVMTARTKSSQPAAYESTNMNTMKSHLISSLSSSDHLQSTMKSDTTNHQST